MSNRKAHRRENSFRRAEKFVQHRLRRPGRSDRHERQITTRRDRRGVWKLIVQWIGEISEAHA
ncbi:MAG TPA: hypothetical protein VLE97_09735 [Gaiellaceae bacterium]|nr:hypothetical protein [Gaiellaceae bacterium]